MSAYDPDTVADAAEATAYAARREEMPLVRVWPLTDGKTFVRLSERWRVAHDDMQWLLQVAAPSKWQARIFCRTKRGLLRRIRNTACADGYAGIDLEALDMIRAWPDWHREWFEGGACYAMAPQTDLPMILAA